MLEFFTAWFNYSYSFSVSFIPTADGMYDIDEYLFLMYLKWNDQESVDDIKEAFRVFDKVCSDDTRQRV